MPDVSAIVATRNRPQWAAEAVASILAQTQPPTEIIVADDGDDGTGQALAQRFGVQTVTTGGAGPAAARNAAARLARGAWLAFCDDDDTWFPHRLERQLAAVTPTTVLVYADALRSDGRRELLHRNPGHGHVFGSLLLDNWIPTSTVLLRRDAFVQADGFAARYEPAEDYALWLSVCRLGAFAFIDEPLATYRIHAGQLQRNTAPMAGATATVVDTALTAIGWRATQIPNLAMRLRRLRFVEGRALAAAGRFDAARAAYRAAWSHQRAYLNAPLFWMLSYLRR